MIKQIGFDQYINLLIVQRHGSQNRIHHKNLCYGLTKSPLANHAIDVISAQQRPTRGELDCELRSFHTSILNEDEAKMGKAKRGLNASTSPSKPDKVSPKTNQLIGTNQARRDASRTKLLNEQHNLQQRSNQLIGSQKP